MKTALSHLRSKHKNIKQYECDSCTHRFNLSENLQSHKVLHSTIFTDGLVKCSIGNCTKEFRRMVVFRRHLLNRHMVDDNFICKLCKRPFPTVMELEQHRLSHVSLAKRRSDRKRKEIAKSLASDELVKTLIEKSPNPVILEPKVLKVLDNEGETMPDAVASIFNRPSITEFTLRKPQPLHDALTALDEIVGTIRSSAPKPERRRKVRKTTKYKVQGPLAGPLQIAPLDSIPNPVPAFAPQNELDLFATTGWPQNHSSTSNYNDFTDPVNYSSQQGLYQPYYPHMVPFFSDETKQIHSCNFCGRIFKTARYLRHHMVSHSGFRQHMCNICGKSFSRVSVLNKHRQSIHQKTIFYPCGRCGKHFYRKDMWRRHQVQHQSARHWACPYCYSRFKTRQNCLKHIKTHQAKEFTEFPPNLDLAMSEFPIGPMTELLQNEDSNQIDTLMGSFERENLPKGSVVTEIDNILPNLPHTDDQDTEKNIIIDEILGDEFSSKKKILKKSLPKPLSITLSKEDETKKKAKKSPPSKRKRAKKEWVEELREIPPSMLEKTTSEGKTIHNQIQLGPAEVDEIASVKEVSNQYRVKHNISLSEKYLIDTAKEKLTGIPSHEPDGPIKGTYRFTCKLEDCNKVFTRKNDLTRHQRVHSGDKPFICEKCDAKFSLKSTLTKHLRRHSDVKDDKYKCHICEKHMNCSSSLKRHLRVHTGAKPFSCDRCKMGFVMNDKRQRHMKTCKADPSTNPKPVFLKITPLCEEMLHIFRND